MPNFVRRKVDIEFTQEEKAVLKQAQEILREIEDQGDDFIELVEEKYTDFVFIGSDYTLQIAIDCIGAIMASEEKEKKD